MEPATQPRSRLMTLHRDAARTKRPGFTKATDSGLPTNATLTFASGGRSGAKIATTLGDLIVALTNESHQFVADEQETYKWVAYLLSARLSRRPRDLFVSQAPDGRASR